MLKTKLEPISLANYVTVNNNLLKLEKSSLLIQITHISYSILFVNIIGHFSQNIYFNMNVDYVYINHY